MPFKAQSLTPCISEWTQLGASQTVITWITKGIPIVFNSDTPPAFELRNHSLTAAQVKFIDSEIAELLHCKAIARSVHKPACVSPLGVVPKKRNRLRLILDLRQLNRYCLVQKFQYEDITTAIELVEPEDQFITADLENGFLHLPIRTVDQKYFGFCWRGRYYVWRSLPFGWKGSPFHFHKTVRCVISYLRQQGLRITSYVDDFLLLGSKSNICNHKQIFLDTLRRLGWQLNLEKCKLDPVSRIEYIGFMLDTTAQGGTPCIKVPHSRIRKVRKDLRRLLDSTCFSGRRLAVVLGQCVSMARAIFPAKLMLRNAYHLLSTKKDWDSKGLLMDTATRQDLQWWVQGLEHWNGVILKHRPHAVQISTDASGSGWGGYHHDLKLSAKGHWDKTMKARASNFREIVAVYLSLKSFAHLLQGSAVTVLSDNVTATAYLNHMGGPRHTMSLVSKAVWALAHSLDMSLTVRYLAGKNNVLADQLSRQVDPYEWQLHPYMFQRINRAFGPHTIDRFASFQTAHLPRYNSALYDPAAEAVDALSQSWTQEVNFVNPPFRLLTRCLNLIQDQKAKATIIAPMWPAQPWFRKLVRMSIATPIRIPNSPKYICQLSGLPEPLRNRKWRLYAWNVSGQTSSFSRGTHLGSLHNYHSVGPDQHVKLTIDSCSALLNFAKNEADRFHV